MSVSLKNCQMRTWLMLSGYRINVRFVPKFAYLWRKIINYISHHTVSNYEKVMSHGKFICYDCCSVFDELNRCFKCRVYVNIVNRLFLYVLFAFKIGNLVTALNLVLIIALMVTTVINLLRNHMALSYNDCLTQEQTNLVFDKL